MAIEIPNANDPNWDNMRRCPSYDKCSLNLCPLDVELELRVGGTGDSCKWMREPSHRKIGDKEFVSGGSIMSDELLKYVPKKNIERLNQASQDKLKELDSQ